MVSNCIPNSLQGYSDSLVFVSIQPLDSPRRAEQVKHQLLLNIFDAFFPKENRNNQAMKWGRQQELFLCIWTSLSPDSAPEDDKLCIPLQTLNL